MNFFKKTLSHILIILGLYSLFHYLMRSRITILYLHSITDPKESQKWDPLKPLHTTDDLKRNLLFLSEKYTFISLSTAIKILKKEQPPVRNGLVITLDDGYLNNLTLGTPIYIKHKIIPTIFIATNHTEKNLPFWFDRLDYALQQLPRTGYTTKINNTVFFFDCDSRSTLAECYKKFKILIKKDFLSDLEMQKFLLKLSEDIEKITRKSLITFINSDPHSCLATWEQLQTSLSNKEIEVGSHTINHTRLALTDLQTATQEIALSKKIIKEKLDTTVDFLCYPNSSYDKQTTKLASQHYQCALTTTNGLNSFNTNLMHLKRFNFPMHQDKYKVLFSISALQQVFRFFSLKLLFNGNKK